MSTNTNDEALKYQWRLKEWFPDLSPKTITTLQSYFELVVKHNKVLNLISPKTIPVADALHIADSILGSQIIRDDSPTMKEIYDFGSGSGFPGLVFAILYPEIQVVLVDSDPRKVEFLNQVISTLSLTNARTMHAGVEALAANSVQYAMTRGFANISKTILLSRKPISKNGIVYHMKGDQWGLEITEIPTQLCSIWSPGLVQEYMLPNTQIRYGIVKTTKH